MPNLRKPLSCLALAILFLALIPSSTPAQEASSELEAPTFTEAPAVYRIHAAPLGFPSWDLEARIEYRVGDRLLDTQTLRMAFGDRDSVLIPLRLPPEALREDGTEELTVHVFAGGRLLDVLDRGALVDYRHNLRFQLPDRFELGGPGLEDPGAGLVPAPEKIQCDSPCGGGCGLYDDYDCDGVNNSIDNCTDDYNPGQEDCDGDGYGDVCDAVDGVFQASGSESTCMTDKDDHVTYITFEHHVEQRLVDVSSCNSPDRWDRWVRSDADCYNLSDSQCCKDGIGTSIEQVGDDKDEWCGSLKRNVDFCH